jgi:hypothetical protein
MAKWIGIDDRGIQASSEKAKVPRSPGLTSVYVPMARIVSYGHFKDSLGMYLKFNEGKQVEGNGA